MSYKHNCNCGKPNCSCHNHNHFVDLSCMETQPYDDAQTLLGLNNCGKVVSVEKPEPELSDIDRQKLDMLEVDGDGKSALYNDGTYKETYTKDQTDNAIETSLEDAVFYNSQNNIEPRADIIIGRNNEIRAKNSDGSEYKLVQATTIGITNYGDESKLTNLVSSTRPVAQLSGESITGVHPLAFVEDVDAVSNDLNDFKTDTVNKFTDVNDRIDNLSEETTSGFESVNNRIDTVETDVANLRTSTTAALNTVNDAINDLDGRVTVNKDNITINTSDIQSLRDEINAQDKFKGYFNTNSEIQLIPGESGAYAWSAESGTVWIYDGNSWVDSGDQIPDQTVDASGSTPLMDGTASAGSSNEYSRGDHRHPTDTTRAAASDLNNYLQLSGNTQTTRMTGDIWLGSNNKLRTSDTGNSYIGQDTDLQQTQIVTSGIGGVDIQTTNGTAKYNGKEIVSYEENGDIHGKNNIILDNDNKLLGTEQGTGIQHNLIELSRFGIVDVGSQSLPTNISSSTRPTAQLSGETGAQAHGLAFIEEITAVADDLNNFKSDTDSRLTNLEEEIEAAEHFKGYFRTTAEITSLPAESGAFAWNGETGTVWVYDTSIPSWVDSGDPIPSETPYDGLPEMDGTANAGTVNEYSRGNHVHPTDTSRASVAALSVLEGTVSQQGNSISVLQSTVSGNSSDISVLQSTVSSQGTRLSTAETNIYDLQGRTSANESAISTLQTSVATNSSDIQILVGNVSSNTTDISTLKSDVSTVKENITSLDSRVSTAESNIGTNRSDIDAILTELANQEKFRGYYETTAEILALIGSAGDYAWNGETNTVWLYDGNTWADSGTAIPTGAGVSASDLTPLMDGDANAGSSNAYSRGDHRHPTDTSRAAAADVTTLSNTVSDIEDEISGIREDLAVIKNDIGILSAVGVTSIDLPEGVEILMVNYNRLVLFTDDYSVEDNTLSIINDSILSDFEIDDRIEITYNF